MRRRNRKSSTESKLARRKAAIYQNCSTCRTLVRPASTDPRNNSKNFTESANFVKTIYGFSLEKAGSLTDECEDAYLWEISANVCRVGIADGATESSFAKEWAKKLVSQFVKTSISKFLCFQNHIARNLNDPQNPEENAGSEASFCKFPICDWLKPLQETWATWLAEQNLLWFAKRKAEQGTYATLLGLEIQANREWQAIAVGDSCLFVVRNRDLLYSFPLAHSSEFGYRPQLLGTKLLPQNISPIAAHFIANKAEVGDRFYLATDALAAWILANLEMQKNPWVELDRIRSQAAFLEWITNLRDRREIANDDTTLMQIQI
jgi:hypothetical protein